MGAKTCNMKPGIAIVIPHLEHLSDTAACVASLREQTCQPDIIQIVDNASQTHSGETLAQLCPGAHVLRLDSNRGFAGGVNEGIKKVLSDRKIDFVWVLNNDTICPPPTLELLLECILINDRIGLAGTPLLEGSPPDDLRPVAAAWKLRSFFKIPAPAKEGEAFDYLSGASLLVRRAVMEELGGFDENFFFFFEDVDFSLRARKKGWSLSVAHNASIRHTGSATIGRMSASKAAYYRAGHVLLLRRYSPLPRLAAWPPYLFRLAVDLLCANGAALRGNHKGWRRGWALDITCHK